MTALRSEGNYHVKQFTHLCLTRICKCRKLYHLS